MRVVMVQKTANLSGGGDQHCFGLAEALTNLGHEIRFLSTQDSRNLVDEGVFVPVTVTHASREKLSLTAQAAVFSRALWNVSAAEGMRRLIAEFRPDVVHTHKLYPQLSVAPVVVAARAGVPVVQTLHDFELVSASPIDARGGIWDRDETRFRYRLLNSALRPVHRRVHTPRVAAFVAVSRFVAKVHAKYGVDATVLPNFVPPSDDGPLPPFEEREGIVFLGRLQPEKGALDIVELASRLSSVSVTVVGSGDLEPVIRRAEASIPNLRVAGFVSDPELRDALRRARVVVIPSRCQDAGPLVPLEAMANATPVVAYAMGGLSEYVTDSGGGRVVPVDVEALAEAAADLHDDQVVWERHSESARAAIAERHTPAVYAGRIEEIYERVVDERPASRS
jgi:glycosyltransferase involved in cell wall biosynthesis